MLKNYLSNLLLLQKQKCELRGIILKSKFEQSYFGSE